MNRLVSSITAPASSIIAATALGRLGRRAAAARASARRPASPSRARDALHQPGDDRVVGPLVGEQHDLLARADREASIQDVVEARPACRHALLLRRIVASRARAANAAYTFVASWISSTGRCSSGQYTGGPPGPKITVGHLVAEARRVAEPVLDDAGRARLASDLAHRRRASAARPRPPARRGSRFFTSASTTSARERGRPPAWRARRHRSISARTCSMRHARAADGSRRGSRTRRGSSTGRRARRPP